MNFQSIKLLKLVPDKYFTTFYKIKGETPNDLEDLYQMYNSLFRIREDLQKLKKSDSTEQNIYFLISNFLENAFIQIYEFKNYFCNPMNTYKYEWNQSFMFSSIMTSLRNTNKQLLKLYEKNNYEGEKYTIKIENEYTNEEKNDFH